MKAMNISLPTGPFDWAPEILPRAEFERRLEITRAAMRIAGLGLLIVHGDGFDHGALSWVSGFTPKLGAAYALIPLEGEPGLIVSGSPGMKPSALRLSWIADMTVQRDLADDIRKWIEGHGGLKTGLYEGQAMAQAAYVAVLRGAGETLSDMTSVVDDLRRRKSACEIALIVQAGRSVEAALAALEQSLPRGRRHAIIAAERAAYAAGAQDVRVLTADRAGGAPRPLDDFDPVIMGSVPVAVAARVRGYWASAETVLGDDKTIPAREAKAILHALATTIDLSLTAEQSARWSLSWQGIGLSLEEAPQRNAPLRAGDVVCARLSLKSGSSGHIAWTAILAIDPKGARLLQTA